MATDTKNTIKDIIELFGNKDDKDLIQRAFDLAEKAHDPQKRESGEPYIIHPLDAALTLAKMGMDAQTVAAALLHDVVDDTPVTLKEIKEEFGDEVAFLVKGVSKLGKIKYKGAQRHAENLRRMLVAMAQDIRVILIKFADRLHNMKTLDALPERKRRRIALETLEIYAPIAMRLGVSEMAKQLEDLAFPHVYPDEYKRIVTESEYRFRDGEKYLKRLKPILRKELAKESIRPLKIEMRAKHYYSLWRKLEKNGYNWEKIQDLIAIRIIVESVEECYKTLGTVHKLWRPLPGKIKDYIALPKPNGYQSLHTTVFCLDGKQTEIQIRTKEMHENAEYGIAAHWKYKNREGHSEKKMADTYNWVKQLQEWKQDTSPTEEFLDSLRLDVFSDRIFVFTPNGDVFDLPSGATPVDFAYSVHSDVGNKCTAALVNGKIAPLNSELHNGDVVKIITSKNKTPSQAWLNFVKTRTAKNRIRKWFREQNQERNTDAGLNLINQELKSVTGKSWSGLSKEERSSLLEKLGIDDEEGLFLAIGQGDISINRFINKLIDEEKEKHPEKITKREKIKKYSKKHTAKVESDKNRIPVAVAGISGLKLHIAGCCNPRPPEDIVAYVTVDKGASIHKTSCPNIYKAETSEKILPAYWVGHKKGMPASLDILVTDRVGLLKDISQIISGMNVNISSITAQPAKSVKKHSDGRVVKVEAVIEVRDLQHLKKLVEKIRTVNGVLSIQRTK